VRSGCCTPNFSFSPRRNRRCRRVFDAHRWSCCAFGPPQARAFQGPACATGRFRECERKDSGVRLQELGAFGDPGRDPRGHTVSIVYFGFVLAEGTPLRAGNDSAEAGWHLLSDIFPKKGSKKKPSALAFDHREIVSNAYQRLLEGLRDPQKLAGFNLVPENFTLNQLFQVYEAVLHRPIHRRGFAKKLKDMKLIELVGRGPDSGRAQLYRWNEASS
jgi:8-oxo-dGTP diphosphatase